MKRDKVIIVGGGWAGLSCAVMLAQHKIPSVVLEAAPKLGGRARSISMHGMQVDNGQHLFLGAYRNVQKVLSTLGVNPDKVFKKEPLAWRILSKDRVIDIQLPNTPAPLHGLFGLMRAKGLSFKDKLSALQFCYFLFKKIPLDTITVLQLLEKYSQTPTLIENLWRPLCLAALSTPPEDASAQVFSQVLQETFFTRNQATDYWFAKKDLSAILPNPAMEYLTLHDATVQTSARVTELIFQDQTCIGVKTAQDTYYGRAVVLATPYWTTSQLLQDVQGGEAIVQQCNLLVSEAISTIYLQYSPEVQLPHSMTGLIGTQSQWVFDRNFANQPGLIAVVITGAGMHLTKTQSVLAQEIHQEIQQFWPQCQHLLNWRVIHEKRAVFRCDLLSQECRPQGKTSIPGLFLAGDYCQTPYPATLEGAATSGLQCAEEIR
ncbi:MAG TPA: hydroxysqualene dehydroxylase HpnE, partial [Gammaproteobacteria bacterium]|nr:hydroxysqualene dehydroxylase HpnE [Gammaproteobacteria bacterium]